MRKENRPPGAVSWDVSFSSCTRLIYLVFQVCKCSKRTEASVQVISRLLLASCLLLSQWPEQVPKWTRVQRKAHSTSSGMGICSAACSGAADIGPEGSQPFHLMRSSYDHKQAHPAHCSPDYSIELWAVVTLHLYEILINSVLALSFWFSETTL
jgi:hypothetical protein